MGVTAFVFVPERIIYRVLARFVYCLCMIDSSRLPSIIISVHNF